MFACSFTIYSTVGRRWIITLLVDTTVLESVYLWLFVICWHLLLLVKCNILESKGGITRNYNLEMSLPSKAILIKQKIEIVSINYQGQYIDSLIIRLYSLQINYLTF